NPGVQVLRGRSVSITESDLEIQVDLSSDCKVEVVLNEPVTQRVGKLTPQMFDCSFLKDEVRYIHNGSPLLEEDSVLLRVYRFTASYMQVETVVLRVKVVDGGSSVAELGGSPLVVPRFFGLSNTLNSTVLNIRNQEDLVCTVRLMTAETKFPTIGRLRQVEEVCPGNKPCLHHTTEVQFLKTSCQNFLSSGLRYQHLSPPSPDTDYIPIRVELREQATRKLLESQALWLPVLIQGAVQNQPPKPGFMASSILEVDQFILTPLSTATLDATDPETPQDRLVFNVTAPPTEGYITHLEDHTRPVGSFTWLDLHDMKVAYQPPNSSVEFQAIDGFFTSSPSILVHLSIRMSETNAPRVSWNMLDLLEGQSRPITWEELQVVDKDNINAVHLVAVDGPAHGRLSVRVKAFMFQVQDLKEGVVVYHHSDSDSTRDHIIFRISDGHHSIRHKFPINILPKDDSPPFLINNVAVEVPEGGAVRLQEFLLLATDMDSSDDLILYQMVSAPRAGRLVRKSSTLQTVPVDSFLQRDLIQGQISYQHSGDETFEDSFDILLSDSHQPPNLSQTYLQHAVNYRKVAFMPPVEDIGPDPLFVQFVFSVSDPHGGTVSGLVFNITVTPVDNLPPEAFTNLLRVEEGGAAFVTEEHLLVQDRDSPEEELRVEVQKTARHGRLELQGGVLLQGGSFRLPDLRGLQLVRPMNDEPPQLGGGLQTSLSCEEGGRVQMTVDFLSATDRDSDDSRLAYMLARSPGRGELQRAGVKTDKFSQQDLLQGRVYYVHSIGPGPVFDTVTLIISDGEAGVMDDCCHGDAPPPPVPLHGTLPVFDLNITVLPVNNKVPEVTLVDEGSRACLCGGVLGASDPDSPPQELTFHLEAPPLHGFLENVLPMPGSEKSGAGIPIFSLTHLTLGFIRYVQSEHRGVEPTADQMSIRVSDGTFSSAPVPFHIIIHPTNDEPPSLLLTNFTNAGLDLDSGERRVISGAVLEAADLDTPAHQVFYFINTAPRFGKLLLKFLQTESSWTDLEAGQNFTQEQVEMNRVWYHHRTSSVGFRGHDSFRFILSDEDNESPAQSFLISIEIVLQTRPVRLREGQRLVLTTDVLLALDSAGRPEDLVFAVSGPPRHGLVHAVRRPGRPLTRFTQLDVAAHRVCYTHSNDHDSDVDSFFVVTNGASSRAGTLLFTIERSDRIPPTLSINAGLRLQDGSVATVTPDLLWLSDPDTAASNLTFVVTLLPRYGKLLLRGAPLPSPPRFLQTDINQLDLAYRHVPGSPARPDRFYFLPSDGTNKGYLEFGQLKEDPAVFSIQPSTVTDLGAGRYGIFITSRHLRGSDPDSPAELLEFSVIMPPQFGSLENAATSAISQRFTQRDLDRRSVLYIVPVDVDVTADGFWFRLVDPAGNGAPPHLELFWSRVQLSASCYRTCETSRTLQIQIQRGGRSADPAYVSIQQVEEGSAKAGRDFTHSSATLIQFDTVNVKTWSVFPLDDGLEENHETFSVTLRNPQNAVMGQRNTAAVEILD
uniref:Fras1 related extracellular matrix 1b n=1 Tax=Poecilia latipinna TaxID=48699 RepID=A0A3B3UH26_9TELE